MTEKVPLNEIDALVLAGGESRRMGVPKALLPFGEKRVVDAVLDVLRPLFRRVLIVTRDTEGLTGLGVEVLTDDRPERGPLVGLTRGLAASDADWCFMVGCDMPFVSPAVVARMANDLPGHDIVASDIDGRLQFLHAFYSQRCGPHAQQLLNDGDTSLRSLLRRVRVQTLAGHEFRDIDQELLSFRDLDTLDEYHAALAMLDEPGTRR